MNRPDTPIFDTPESRRVMDDIRRDAGAEIAGNVQRFIDAQAAGDNSFKGIRRFVNIVMFVGEFGPGLVALGALAVGGGMFWLL